METKMYLMRLPGDKYFLVYMVDGLPLVQKITKCQWYLIHRDSIPEIMESEYMAMDAKETF